MESGWIQLVFDDGVAGVLQLAGHLRNVRPTQCQIIFSVFNQINLDLIMRKKISYN